MPEMKNRRSARPALRSAAVPALALALAAGLAGCSTDDAAEPAAGTSSGSPSASTSPTTDVSVPAGVELTPQGEDLSFGDTATVAFEPDQKRSTVLDLTVTGARQGTLDDFKGFILDDPYKKKANYYYVDVKVKNVGEGEVGGLPVPLWGVNADNTLLPAVNFTTTFKPCASTPLPKKFGPGQKVSTCLVYLSPDHGTLESLSFRPDQAFDPIEWTGKVEKAKADKPKKADQKSKQAKKSKKNKNG
ncbi:hypothetical protein [Nocardioides mesophilus]|uniref:DUF4352 domain-containing protein n=1 Tax=Nocardioides mesophilus TaxID=433659 RepID=A0A7G9RCJ1_9ACTN|nr:hypothetical protein [Nocardioides mesophilus]QNN53316.1 hypothetical protein H9L09_02230 [Nocardioides mesophilus]